MNLEKLFERQHRRIYRIAMLMLKCANDAEDAVQNVFLKYLEKNVEFRDDEHENAWFITVTRNYCKDQLKSYWKKNVEMGQIPEISSYDEEHEDETLEVILKLPSKYKDVIYLYYYEDYSIAEISQILDGKESTIQTQLAAARKRLKILLEKEVHVG